ncbi:hypothetical protein D3C72_861310 [compost metagenome]
MSSRDILEDWRFRCWCWCWCRGARLFRCRRRSSCLAQIQLEDAEALIICFVRVLNVVRQLRVLLGFRRRSEGHINIRINRCDRPVVVRCRIDFFVSGNVVHQNLTVLIRAVDDVLASFDAREVTAATCAVVIGSHNEVLIRIYRLALVLQVHDPAAAGIIHGTVDVVLRWLGDVDLVRNSVNYIEVIHLEARVQKRLLVLLGRIDLVELACRHFKPILNYRTFNHDGFQGVVIQVQVAGTLNRQRTFCDFSKFFRAVTSCLERGPYRQNRSLGICRQVLLHIVCNIVSLRVSDDLNRRVVLNECEIAVDWSRGGTNRAVRIGHSRFVIRFNGIHYGLIRLSE